MLESIMRQAAFTDLRNNAKLDFDCVEAGESMRVMRNGRAIADIVPIAPKLPTWRRRKAQPFVIDGVSPGSLILNDRE
jgi:antitoxin (DNA-binding transcriptional repressor) of toxin-antitoxin stability system